MMAAVSEVNHTVRLRPLTARSAILSLLLGVHPPSATVSELVAFGRYVDVNDSAASGRHLADSQCVHDAR